MDNRLVSGSENNKDSQQKLSAIFKDFTDLKTKSFVTYNYNKTYANKPIKQLKLKYFYYLLQKIRIAKTLQA